MNSVISTDDISCAVVLLLFSLALCFYRARSVASSQLDLAIFGAEKNNAAQDTSGKNTTALFQARTSRAEGSKTAERTNEKYNNSFSSPRLAMAFAIGYEMYNWHHLFCVRFIPIWESQRFRYTLRYLYNVGIFHSLLAFDWLSVQRLLTAVQATEAKIPCDRSSLVKCEPFHLKSPATI